MRVAARVTLKQHRFEVGAAVFASLVIAVFALILEYRLRALDVPPGCVDNWLGRVDGLDGAGFCLGPMRAWGEVLEVDGGLIFGVMKYLPFGLGLLVGVPIVASELEARTAQTAWSLDGSRQRWLLRQIWPVLVLLGATLSFTAVATSVLAANNVAWGGLAYFDIGLHGPLIVARAFGAFGVGLLVGALLGRTLPAFVLGACLMVALFVFVGRAQDAWLAGLEPTVIGTSSAEGDVEIDRPTRVVQSGWGWRAPDGTQLSFQEGLAVVPAEIADGDDPVQYPNSTQWLLDHGYASLALGVTDERALGWAPYDALAFSLIGAASLVGAAVVVSRRRPT